MLHKVKQLEEGYDAGDSKSDLVSDVVYFAKTVIFMLKDSTFLYFGFILICSGTGFINKSYFVYSLLLFEVVVGFSRFTREGLCNLLE